MARYWIADLHLGHKKVSELRGFETVEEHDSVIIGQLAKLIPGDSVWVLGDISSGRPEGEDYALKTLSENVRASLHLIMGNHDSASSIHRNGYKQHKRFLKVFDTIQDFGRVRLHGTNALMSHYPYARAGDGHNREGVRYLEYRLPDTGLPLIHGHTHQNHPHIPTKAIGIDGKGGVVYERDMQQYCVSWDAHRGLVTEHMLNEWIKNDFIPATANSQE